MALPQDGQNANGLTKVTEIPKGKELIFIDPTTNEGGIITLEDLTTQILKNLTSQTFALDQGTKTLPAALNELNSNSLNGYFHYEKFADIPKRNILCDVRYESASDPEAPDVTMGTYWWNIIQVCLAENRILQIASSAFNQRDVLYFRVKHDNNWYGWYYVIGQEKR